MKLLIAIPALNEAEAIDDIIRRSLVAREGIIAGSPVDEVEITVVSDGSTDETAERTSRYLPDVNLIVFPVNRGYGAAIKEAWARSDAELLGFLDADGTCDPEFFSVLCSTLLADEADVALGCRMNSESQMPRTRRIGNTLFALLMTQLGAKGVRDVASGMRVVRRSSLTNVFPLPDGLHFTPAMSARALLGGDLRLVEMDMPYQERTGRSKLRVFRDGLRFLRIIGETAFLYRPGRILWGAAGVFMLGAMLLVLRPLIYYADHRSLQDWMIYRCAGAALLTIGAFLLLTGGYLATRVTDLAIFHRDRPGLHSRLRALVGRRGFYAVPASLVAVAVALAWTGLGDYLFTGHVDTHWSRVLAILSLLTIALILLLLKVLDLALSLVQQRVNYLINAGSRAESRPPLGARGARSTDVGLDVAATTTR